MKELRCKKCNKLLLKHDCKGDIEIKCTRCGVLTRWIPIEQFKQYDCPSNFK